LTRPTVDPITGPAVDAAAGGPAGRLIARACEVFALAGGAILALLALMAIVSIVGRNAFSSPIQGDFELMQLGCAVAVAFFLPFCQLRRGNIIVDFFTARASVRSQAVLDAFGALLLAVVMTVVAWRTGEGAIAMRASNETSMIISLPIWYAYALMTPAFALTALAGLHGVWSSLRSH